MGRQLDEATLARLRAAVGVEHAPEPVPEMPVAADPEPEPVPEPEPEPEPTPPPRHAFVDANDRRSREAAAKRVERATEALDDLTAGYTHMEVVALQLRVRYPVDTLAQLGEKVGVSKNVISSALRRACRKAERIKR